MSDSSGIVAAESLPRTLGVAAERAGQALAATGVALIAIGIVVLAITGRLQHHRAIFYVFYGVAALGYLLVLRNPSATPRRVAIVVAVLLRLAFLPVTPSLSDDVYRYVWDGRVQASGIDPYLYAPADAHLNGIAYADRPLVNHPQVKTIYPPAAEGLFLAVGGAGGGVLAYRLVFGAFDLLAAAAICLLVQRRRRGVVLMLYLLCPLTILETWGSVHLEVVSVAFVLLSVAMLRRRRDVAAGVALGLAVAFKVTPLALVIPALVGKRARPLPFLAGFLPALLLPYAPYLAWGGLGGVTGSLFSAGGHQNVDSLVFFLLHQVMPYGAAAAVCAVAAAACLVLIAQWLPGRQASAAVFAWSATVVLLFMPAVHSWYWLAPLALSLAAGLRLPIYLGLAGPAAEVGWLIGGAYRGWAHLLGYAPLIAGGPGAAARLLARYTETASIHPASKPDTVVTADSTTRGPPPRRNARVVTVAADPHNPKHMDSGLPSVPPPADRAS